MQNVPRETESRATPDAKAWKTKAAKSFSQDFGTGCMTLVSGTLIAIAIAAAIGMVIMVYHVARVLTVPVAGLALLVIITLLVGRIVNFLRDRW